jgi:hypothetical protein
MARLLRWLVSAGGRSRQFRRVDQPGRGDREADYLDRRRRVAVAEAAGMFGVEGPSQSRPIRRVEVDAPPP